MEEVFPSYHVFINHRGPDVKNTLASLIYRALKRFGLRVFLDEHELQTGDSLPHAIMAAISSSSVHIAIFSPTYAESAWCLNELLWMLGCQGGAKLIPIFYDIHPSDLRYVDKGAYAEAIQSHKSKGRVGIPVVERWIHAFNRVSHISGQVFSQGKDDLGALLDKIVDVVLPNVASEPLDVGMHPVGLDQAAQDFQNEILNPAEFSESSSPMVVGIVGLGGSGKSTLVTHLYNSKRSEFNRSCFLSVGTKDLEYLQQKLLTDLLGCSKLSIENTRQGRSLLRDRLRGFPRVLIVFDNIDNAEQIENLLLVRDVVGNGSLSLIASRDRDLLLRSQISKLYDVKLLGAKDAQELFCRPAFHQPKPLQDLQDLVAELVNICGGFPLALKVLGGQLCGSRDRSYWMRKLLNFQTHIPDDILQKVLKVSYHSLQDKEKDAFLDIAHFLIGEDRDLAVRVLEGLFDCNGLDYLDTLHQKCLVEFEIADVDFNVEIQTLDDLGKFDIALWRRPKGSFKIRMHDLVRELARQMGREQPLLRLCCRNDARISTQLQSKPYSVRGIRRDEDANEDEGKLQLPLFLRNEDICGLKLLVFQHSVNDLQTNSLSGDLIWLRMRKFNCNDILSSRLSLRALRVLELTDVNYKDLPPLSDDVSELRELTVTSTEN